MRDQSTKLRAQSRSNIERAFEKNQSSLKRFIARLLMNDHDVEDVAQETFLKAYQAELGKEIEQPKSYLFRIAKNIVISQIRQQRRRPTDYIEDLESPGVIEVMDNEWSAEDEAMAQQKLGFLSQAVVTLSPQVRRAYLMRKVYGMSHKEIAQQMGIARSTVEKHLIKGGMTCDRFVREKMAETAPGEVAGKRQRSES